LAGTPVPRATDQRRRAVSPVETPKKKKRLPFGSSPETPELTPQQLAMSLPICAVAPVVGVTTRSSSLAERVARRHGALGLVPPRKL
jgi:hypothetical protein